MDRRRILLIVAAVVALLGTALVFVYVKGADKRAQSQFETVQVLKATQDIGAGEAYDDALNSGKIALADVPKDQLVTGYQVTTTALKGKFSSQPIHAGEQVITSMWGDTLATASTNLAIPTGKIAITVQLSDADRVAGNVYAGSKVAIFVTHLGGPEHPVQSQTQTGATEEETALLLPDVLVLNVGDPATSSSTTTKTDGTSTTETLPKTLLTIAVSQKDAQKVILASKESNEDLTFALKNATSTVNPGPGQNIPRLFK